MRGKRPTYSAIILTDHGAGRILYAHQPSGNLQGDPFALDRCGTLDRSDGGDPFECARFTSAGRVYEIKRD